MLGTLKITFYGQKTLRLVGGSQVISSRSSGKEEKAWGQIGPPPWVLKGPKYAGSNNVKQASSYKLLRELSNQVLSSGISKETHISMFISGDTGRGHVSDLVKCDISYDLHYL